MERQLYEKVTEVEKGSYAIKDQMVILLADQGRIGTYLCFFCSILRSMEANRRI